MAARRPVQRRSVQRRPRGQHDPVYRVLCDLVLKVRQDAELTQRDLAALLRRDRKYVWKCEQGERRMDVVDVIRWAKACGADPLAIFRRIIAAEGRRSR